MVKEEGVDERMVIQAMVKPQEKIDFEDKISEQNKERRKNGDEKIYSSRLFRQTIISFTKDPKKFLAFINFK